MRPDVASVEQFEMDHVRRERPTRSIHRTRDTCDFTGPVMGQARALVSCVPSPYDTDVLSFQVS